MIRKYTSVIGSKLSYFLSLMVDTRCSFYLNLLKPCLHLYVDMLLHILLYFRIKKLKRLNPFFSCTFHSTQRLLTPRGSFLCPEFKCQLCLPDAHVAMSGPDAGSLRSRLAQSAAQAASPLGHPAASQLELVGTRTPVFCRAASQGPPPLSSGSSVHQPPSQNADAALFLLFLSFPSHQQILLIRSLKSRLNPTICLLLPCYHSSGGLSYLLTGLFLRLPLTPKSVLNKAGRTKLSKWKSDLVTHLLKTLPWHPLTHRLNPRVLPWLSVLPP